jgi:DNA mismatch endonuclease (patch repair protein)
VVDTRTPEQRRRIMAAVRSADTAPEMRLRQALYAAGVRGWRCHYRRAPGRPDLAWPALRVAVFVDGAFWHGHPSRHRPGRSGSYWDEKIARNVERDRQVDAELEDCGWAVVRMWDFEVARELPTVVEHILGVLRERVTDAAGWQGRLVSGDGAATLRDARATTQRRTAASQEKSFAERLRELRARAGLSRRELAEASGLDESTIAAYERGVREPKLETIVKLARGLGVTPTTIVRDVNSSFGLPDAAKASVAPTLANCCPPCGPLTPPGKARRRD